MNDNTIIILGVCVSVVSMYALFVFEKQVLKNSLRKESESLRLQMNKAQKILNEFGVQPEEMVSEGLSSLLPMLKNLDISEDMLKQFGIPSWAMPIAKGFIDKMKTKGTNDAVKTVNKEGWIG